MRCDLTGWTEPPPPPADLTIERVRDRGAFHEAAVLHVDGFEYGEVPAEQVATFETCYGEVATGPYAPLCVYVVRDGDRPVATGWGLLDDDVVGVYGIATLPDARGRGAGTGFTARIMADAKAAGARTAILESSEMGESIYRRLGFRTVCEAVMLRGLFDGT